MIDLYPAIDLKDGAAVRLFKGDMASAKVYGQALDFALEFQNLGLQNLHIVDLNGAFEGKPCNFEIIAQIAKRTNLRIQIGGGVRDEETIKKYLDCGVNRVILGSVALKKLDFALQMASKYPVAIGIDARNGKVKIAGWAEDGGADAFEFARKFRGSGVQAIIATDIENDGTLQGLNVDFVAKIAQESGIYTIASGGLASADELDICAQNPHISGVIIGKAFYERKIDLGAYLVR